MSVKLHHGDCLDIMDLMPDNSVDLTVTSPPYDNLRTYNDSLEWGEHVWKPVLEQLYRVTNEGGVVVWIVNDATTKGSETGTSFRQALYAMECGFRLHDTMMWHKPNPIPRTHRRYESAFEYMFVFSVGAPGSWNPIKEPCKLAGKTRSGTIQMKTDGVRTPKNKGGLYADLKTKSNVWSMANSGTGKHPACFPEQMASDHIISWSNEGDTVLDPFMGSATTGVACQNTNRNYIGIEKDADYFKIAQDRIIVKEGK